MNMVATGASGLLGANLLLAARERGARCAGVRHRAPLEIPGVETVSTDLNDAAAVDALLARIKPDWIVHCAAATDVDWCEAHPDEARRVNAGTTGVLAAAARRAGAGLLLVSTDSVFDGRTGGYVEGDATGPLNVYARTKLEAEDAVRDAGLERHLIVRSNLFGWNAQDKTSLAEWIVRELEAGRRIKGFRDVVFAPLLVNDLSSVLLDLMAGGTHGLFHAAAPAPMSKLEFARAAAAAFGLDASLIDESSIDGAPLKARRPKNTSLNAARLTRTLGRALPGLPESLDRFRALRDDGYAARLKTLTRGATA
jgi:dTDP-4-dehydrorhamnose reductase